MGATRSGYRRRGAEGCTHPAVGGFRSGMPRNLRSHIVLPVTVIAEHRELRLHGNRLSPHIDAWLQAILDALLPDKHSGCLGFSPTADTKRS